YTPSFNYEADVVVDFWRVWVQGKTLETIANQTYNVASCAGTFTLMNPSPAFGVPGYTYVWSNGATTSTINANNAQSPYSVTVTDACGAQKVVTFTVICPLSVTLNNFNAEKINRQVLLSWETASEKDNDYFLIERAGEDGVFSSIGKTKAIGNSNTLQSYSFYDENPLMGTSYYRLKIYDTQGNESISEVKSVGFDGGSELRIIPNPNKGNYQIGYHFPEKGTYLVELYSTRGEKLVSNQISIDKSGYKEVKLDEVSLPTGVYFVKLYTNNQVLIEKMIIE
ncbi:MAG: T9SS type A sorting domain-containing protein, partial [Crocinitomicaceae bacterium]